MKNNLIGKKCFLQTLEGGQIPERVLEIADELGFMNLNRLLSPLTIYATGNRGSVEFFSFQELPMPKQEQYSYGIKNYFFPSEYFQIEATPNHPLTDIFSDYV